MSKTIKPLKIIFAGTPQFAVPALQALIDSSHEVVAVYTQPDRPAGRGQKLVMSPVKSLALEHAIPVYQPTSLKDAQQQSVLASLKADLMVVTAYGLLLPQAVLDAPQYGCINIHGSLLPAWRGAAPIQYSILNGDSETGVTIMKMDKGLDTGDMMYMLKCPITRHDASFTLYETLSRLGAEALMIVLNDLPHFLFRATAQNESLASYAPKILKSDAEIHWSESAKKIHQRIRAYVPWPVAITHLSDLDIKIHAADLMDIESNAQPGTLVKVDKDGIDVATGKGILRITRLQFPGGRVLEVHEALNSRRDSFVEGQRFREIPHDNTTT